MIRISLIASFLFLCQGTAYASPSLDIPDLTWAFNQTIGYNCSFSNTVQHSMNYQGNILFVNYGYAYQFNVGSKVYAGLSTLKIGRNIPIDMRFQYGRSFSENQNLIRISFDYSLFSLPNGPPAINSFSTIGLFVEKNFGNNMPLNGFSFGVALNWSLWDIFIIGGGWGENQKYFRKRNKKEIPSARRNM